MPWKAPGPQESTRLWKRPMPWPRPKVRRGRQRRRSPDAGWTFELICETAGLYPSAQSTLRSLLLENSRMM